MPDLLNVLEHKKNSKVLVNGTIYDIGPEGVAKDVADEDAMKLLQNDRVWKPHDPKRASALRAQARAEGSGKMQLLDVSGDPVKVDVDKPGQPMDPTVDVYTRPPVDDPPAPDGPPPVPETAEASEDATEEVVDETEEEDMTKGEEEEGEEPAEWPDPKETMTVAQLHEIAEAYEVDVSDDPQKKILVKRIRKAMYV